ncbi:MAG: GvpL/GvpF family gas vesicle protein [Candidatus Latescibacteria bacterium]|nr:GvpL/GvpF family gas vesicle protein [Candidatus Latescibacterota bacterium]
MSKRNGNGNSGLGKLFYAVILTDRECDFGNIGLDNQRVHSINYNEIGALVSDHPRVDSIKLLRKNLTPYHHVVREAAKHFTTIPAKFGQIARDAGEVSIALRSNYGQIRQELSRLDGKVEMGFKVWWNVENIFKYFIERDRVLKTRRDQLMVGGVSVSRMVQIEFGRYFHDRMEQVRREMTERMLATLPPGEAKIDEIHEERMITNSQLLIKKDLQKPLEEAVDALCRAMGDEYSLKWDGPWPPFSFVDHVELHLGR